MRTVRNLALAAVLPVAALLPEVALAEREITPLVGIRQGTVEFSTGIGCVALEGVRCPFFAKSDDSSTIGVLVDLPVRDRLDIELLVNRQASELTFRDNVGELPLSADRARADLDVTHLQAGLRWSWELGRFRPFGAFGAGFTRLESDPLFNGSIGITRASASLAAGARVRLGERVGLRLEARGYRVDLPSELGPHMPLLRQGDDLEQTELTTGLAVRF